MNAIERVLAEARKHIGYAEEPHNRTMFALALDSEERPPIPRQGSAWCGTFTDYVFKRAAAWAALMNVSFFSTQAGLAKARRTPGLLVLPPGEAQPGDLIIKTYTPSTGHIGIVESTDGRQVTTIEGNTALGNDRSGGKVMRRHRLEAWWTAVVRPNWALLGEKQAPVSGRNAGGEWVPAIDVARYQGDIQWAGVKQAGVELAIIKLHNSHTVDSKAYQYLDGARAAGVAVAGYWYAHSLLKENPKDVAQRDLEFARRVGGPHLFLMADIENGENCPLSIQCIAWWDEYIAALPTDVWLYGGSNYLAKFDQRLVGRHKIITARYPKGNTPVSAKPSEWDELALGWGKNPQWPAQWDGWQFTSSGVVLGVPARCDLNIIRRSSLGWTDQGDPVVRTLKIVQEAGKPALYLASSDGIAYRWIKDQEDLAFARFLVVHQGGDPEVEVVPDGKLSLFGVLVGPEPVQ